MEGNIPTKPSFPTNFKAILSARMEEFPWAMLANGPAWTNTGVPYNAVKLSYIQFQITTYMYMYQATLSRTKSDKIGSPNPIKQGLQEIAFSHEPYLTNGTYICKRACHKRWHYTQFHIPTSNVCIRLGLIASFMRTARAPPHPRSSAVTGTPSLLLATTILPRRSRISSRLVVSARTAMISLATVMSNWHCKCEM